MVTCTFHGLTKEQAEEMATWFCEAGEQEFDMWCECQDEEIEAVTADVCRDGGYKEIDEDGNVNVYCK